MRNECEQPTPDRGRDCRLHRGRARVGNLLWLLLAAVPACDASFVTEPESALAVRTRAVELRDLVASLDHLGTVAASSEVPVVSRVAGVAAQVHADEGEPVQAGAPLVTLLTPELDARLARVRAEALRAEESERFVCARAREDEALAAGGAISSLALEAGRRACIEAGAGYTAAGAAVAELAATRSERIIRAPVDGRVSARLVEPGQVVLPGMRVAQVAGHAREARVAIGAADLERGVRVGMPARIATDHGAGVTGVVRSIAPRMLGPGRLVEARVTLPDDVPWSLGAAVRVRFEQESRRGVPAVPAAAIASEQGEFVLYVVRDDRLERLVVEPVLQAGDWVAVSPAPEPGRRVAVSGLERLGDGKRIYELRLEGQP